MGREGKSHALIKPWKDETFINKPVKTNFKTASEPKTRKKGKTDLFPQIGF